MFQLGDIGERLTTLHFPVAVQLQKMLSEETGEEYWLLIIHTNKSKYDIEYDDEETCVEDFGITVDAIAEYEKALAAGEQGTTH